MNDLPALPEDLDQAVARALAEDVGTGDVTAELIPPERHCRARVVCREHAVLAGAAWFERVFAQVDDRIAVTWHRRDGDALAPGDLVCELQGPARGIVTGERTALNFLQTLSATATATRRCVEALGDSNTRILDTRKTLPGLRAAQKYAVRAGGGANHRMGLYDAILIKENHIAAAGSIAAAVAASRAAHPDLSIEVEVENETELNEAIEAGADIVLLDNFDDATLARAHRQVAGRAKIEISGGVELEALPRLARAGADYISVGALTKHVRAVDFSMRIEVS